ncbi:hypothetical protein FH972_018141 [Carpinus fangiana]|uniref:Transcription repressor n=1 Tax=Carpinus fangiana TaxID=176857 RepID=A0A5N6RP32_9ROSI|nr:hypothetical protein FH972_018141 [Carpinus fangiana]
MALAKRFKHKFSFQFCRFNHRSALPVNPLPAIYRLPPVNTRAVDIANTNVPAPPSTPEQHPYKRHVSTNTVSVGCGSQSRSIVYMEDQGPNQSRFCNEGERKRGKEVQTSMFCNDGEEDEESETLILSSTSFSNDWSHNFINSVGTVSGNSTEKEMDNVKKANRGLRRCESISASASALRRMIACTVHGTKVRESFAVVKRTEDPYEDFKRSMLEMILEKQIFETKDLEELLRCFLSLNSRLYHGVIVEAFSEIWELLFCDSPEDHRASRIERL